jgi:hypothetical protein
MAWLERHSTWIWAVSIVAGIVVVLGVRVASEHPTPSTAGTRLWRVPDGPSRGVITGESSDLATAARRARVLQDQVGQMRQELASLQTEAITRRQRIAAINEMLAGDSYTDTPVFLREDTTVRALQKIIREAAGSPDPSATQQDRLSTAATVARERLRAKLEALREQLAGEASDLDARAESLRQRVRLQSEEAERLQREMQKELHSRLHPELESVG